MSLKGKAFSPERNRQTIDIDAAKLRAFRVERGLTQRAFALRSGVPYEHYRTAEAIGRLKPEYLDGLLAACSMILAREREDTEQMMERSERAGI